MIQMASQPIGVGLVGCGDIAPAHAKALASASGAKLVACMDVVESSAKSLGEEHGVPWMTGLDELLGRPEVELVTIATPAFTHLPITEAAAKARKHVLCEKPLAASLPEADGMIAACKRAGVALSTCFPLRYLGPAKWVKSLNEAGALGEVIEIRLHGVGAKPESYWTGGYSGRTTTDWRKSRAQSGGGVIITNLIHNIDLARAVTGLEVARAYAETGTFTTDVEVEDLGIASLRYSNQAIGLLEASSCFLGGGVERDFTLLGTKGQVRFGFWGGKCEGYFTEPIQGMPAGEWVPKEFQSVTHVDFYNDLGAALRAGKRPPVTGEDGRAALEVVLAIYRSADSGQPVELPL